TTSTPNAVVFYHPGAATRVGINLTNPAYAIDLPNNANASGQGRANAWNTYSSRRWKENINPIEDALDKVLALRGVSFQWKESKKHDLGFIAEEVGDVVPEVVTYEENGVDAQSMDYARLVALLVEGIKAQQKEIESLKSEVKALQTGVAGK
ncbi:MAG TPA: tail fiber domain-containing protein, partial [candidate division Zixibacteria bacterium]